VPASAGAAGPKTITISAVSPTTGNCIPFGDGGFNSGAVWEPNAAFIYKNIPPFQLKANDFLAFDTSGVNDVDVQMDVALAPTTANGNDVNAQPFTTVVTNSQTPANPRGDTTTGNYDLQFKAQAPFNFAGGGLIIRFSNASPTYAADTTCTSDLIAGNSTDTSGFFVERAFADANGASPWDTTDGFDIGVFRLTLFPTSNLFSFGKVTRNKHKGTARLAVNVPGPGTLSLTGKNVKPQRPAREATTSAAVTAPGTVKLLVKARGKAKKKLNKTGKAKINVNIAFTPSGDPPGDPKTQTKRVKLVKKLG
jgi:hypothetical protein